MKKLYSFLSGILLLSILLMILPSAITCNAEKETDKKILYITDKAEFLYDIKDVEIVNPNLSKINIMAEKVVWIDDKQFDKFRTELCKRYKNGLKTIIISKLLSKNNVRKYYGIKELPLNNESENGNQFSDAKQIAIVAYKWHNFNIIAGVKVVDMNYAEHALIYATEYDYSKLFRSSLSETQSVQLESGYSWSIASSDVDSISDYGVDLSASLQLFYDTNSPDGNGYYYYYTKLINEAEGWNSSSNVGLCRTTTYSTSQSAEILEYGPTNQIVSKGGSVSFTLSYDIGSITYTPESKVKIYKYSGGIDSNGVEVRHQPVGVFNIPVSTDFLRSELYYVARDDSSIYQANSTATAKGRNSTIGVNLSASKR